MVPRVPVQFQQSPAFRQSPYIYFLPLIIRVFVFFRNLKLSCFHAPLKHRVTLPAQSPPASLTAGDLHHISAVALVVVLGLSSWRSSLTLEGLLTTSLQTKGLPLDGPVARASCRPIL